MAFIVMPSLGDFQPDRLGEPGDAVFGGNVRGFERARDQRVRGSDVDDAAPLFHLHGRQREADRMERRGQVDGDDRVPFVDGELVDRRDELDASVVDEDVDGTEFLERLAPSSPRI